MAITSKRRWSFGLRTLMLVVAIVAGPLAGIGYYGNWIRQRHEILEGLSEGGVFSTLRRANDRRPPPYSYPWGLRLCGEEPVGYMKVSVRTRAELDRIKRLFPEAKVMLLDPFIDESSLK